jgi:hypothetical protein
MARRPFVPVPLPNRRNKPLPPEAVPANVRLHRSIIGGQGFGSDRQFLEAAVIPAKAMRKGMRGEPFPMTYALRYSMTAKCDMNAVAHVFLNIKRDDEMPDEDDSVDGESDEPGES